LALLPLLAGVDKSLTKPCRAIVIDFGDADTATFIPSDDAIAAVTLHLGKTQHSVPKEECAKLNNIRFDTVALEWSGSQESAAKANYVGLRFTMGAERTRAYGSLPEVVLKFRDGKYQEGVVITKISDNAWKRSKL
jgi:hypothetical protein